MIKMIATVLSSGRFVSTIDNPYFPLKPGTTTTYAGLAEGCSAREVFRVTTERKIILGVVTTVVHDSR